MGQVIEDRDFWIRWRHREIHCASLHNQNKDNNKLKTKKPPELAENQTVWKSDNQGVKEETFIQTGRRGGDGQRGGEELWQGGGWWNRQSQIFMQINQKAQLGSETDSTIQGPNVGK